MSDLGSSINVIFGHHTKRHFVKHFGIYGNLNFGTPNGKHISNRFRTDLFAGGYFKHN